MCELRRRPFLCCGFSHKIVESMTNLFFFSHLNYIFDPFSKKGSLPLLYAYKVMTAVRQLMQMLVQIPLSALFLTC